MIVKFNVSDEDGLNKNVSELRKHFVFRGAPLSTVTVMNLDAFVMLAVSSKHGLSQYAMLATPERLQLLRSKQQRVQDVLAGAGSSASVLPLPPPLPSHASGEPSLQDIFSAITTLTTTVQGLQSSVVTREDLKMNHAAQEAETKSLIDSAMAPVIKELVAVHISKGAEPW